MINLEKSILSTLIYYDILDRPLTSFEIFKYCISKEKISLNQILNSLENSPELKERIDQENGFYFLKNRKEIIQERIERQKIADRKWKKAKRIVRLLQVIPFIKLVAISGSLAMNNPKKESDIDLLIITQSRRIWTCRGLITLFIYIIGKKRHGEITRDRICLNHYLTDSSLKINYKSLYNAQTYAHLVPILEIKKEVYINFQKANNWIKEYLIHYPQKEKGYSNVIKLNSLLSLARRTREFFLNGKIGDKLELIFKKFQEKRIKKDPLTHQSGGRVVFDDNQLEFHPNSPEKKIIEKYNWRMKELGLEGKEENSGLTI